jgi:RHS repeat-associated protein
MVARLPRLLVALVLGAALPSAAAAVVRLPTSQKIVASPVPDRGADPANARSYFGARYYRSDIGRFTTVDPELNIKDALVDPQRWNRYAYVTNNPLKYTDPDGKNPLWITGGIGAAVYGGWAIYQNVSHGQPWYNNVGVEASKGLAVGLTLGLAAPAVVAGEAALAAGGTASVWGLAPAARGLAIETMEGGNLGNFPVIDKFANGIATSIKSLDLGAASYQSGSALLSRVTGYVDKLAGFNGASYGRITIAAQDVTTKVLLLVVPPGATEAQTKALQAAVAYGRSIGVTVMTKVAQ